MKLELPDYRTINNHFVEKTGLHCEFVQDSKTLFLKIDGNLFRVNRFDPDIEKATPASELLKSYISLLEEAIESSKVINA